MPKVQITVLENHTQRGLRLTAFPYTHFTESGSPEYTTYYMSSNWDGNLGGRSFGGYIVGLF